MPNEIELVFGAQMTGEPLAVHRIRQNANRAGIDPGLLGLELHNKAHRITGIEIGGWALIGIQYLEPDNARPRRIFPSGYAAVEFVLFAHPGLGYAHFLDKLAEHLLGQPIALAHRGRD